MLKAIALVPSAPVLVPALATGAAAELTDLLTAVTSVVTELPDRWVVIGTGPADDVIGSGAVGTFAGYGADVRVRLSPHGADEARELPLSALIAAWVRGHAASDAYAEVWVYAADLGVDAALDRGRALRAEIDDAADPVGVLVVADGANTLTPPAPGGYDPESIPVQNALDDALACGDAAALTRLPDRVVGRVAYQVLAGLVGSTPCSARERYRGAPYGVGYFVGTWVPRAGETDAIGGSIE
ncbi:MAG: hypothetical protein ABW137_10080 [Mycobacterium sp.]